MALELIKGLKAAFNSGEIRPTGKLTQVNNRTESERLFDSQLTLGSFRVPPSRAQ